MTGYLMKAVWLVTTGGVSSTEWRAFRVEADSPEEACRLVAMRLPEAVGIEAELIAAGSARNV